jgi:hypothetical protein
MNYRCYCSSGPNYHYHHQSETVAANWDEGLFWGKISKKRLTGVLSGVGTGVSEGVGEAAAGVTVTVEFQGPLLEQERVAGVHSEGSVEGSWLAGNG